LTLRFLSGEITAAAGRFLEFPGTFPWPESLSFSCPLCFYETCLMEVFLRKIQDLERGKLVLRVMENHQKLCLTLLQERTHYAALMETFGCLTAEFGEYDITNEGSIRNGEQVIQAIQKLTDMLTIAIELRKCRETCEREVLKNMDALTLLARHR